jgi:hypothetical protein
VSPVTLNAPGNRINAGTADNPRSSAVITEA